ncbi:PP2C family protein-serine/threonine phosphatase [Amycolatopsis sp. NPDC051758]|uniref:PP2C family protein-serine/threonine phosphatase n=1 Tax=Amycolatopsis sp. NPDC051758 TaxID=3363935 RepID=UPI0037A50909
MLTELPVVAGLELAALYRPAADSEVVGGDWYDAYPLPAVSGGAVTLAVSIGDIVGHDTTAATLMGQWRSMLRQADVDHHPGLDPAGVVAALEQANELLGIEAAGTLVHGHLRPVGDGTWELTWTTAGHPRPLVREPDGTVRELAEADRMVAVGLSSRPRTTHRTVVAPGSMLLLYTDGLVDQPGQDADARAAEAIRSLAAHGTRPLPELVTQLAGRLAGPDPDDDVTLLAVRIPAKGA